jgi:DNA-binding transcriptional LysR family regulator
MAAEEKNISRAAARLNRTHPAVSRQIRDLEEELGVTLFDRESKGLALMDAGEAALVHAKDLLRRADGLQAAMGTFKGEPKRSLRIGFIPTALPGGCYGIAFLTPASLGACRAGCRGCGYYHREAA